MDSRMKHSLDNWITGHFGEDQFKEDDWCEEKDCTDENRCSAPGCFEPATCYCDHCDGGFCSDHGTPGGDRQAGEAQIEIAFPAECWRHGGFNADE